MTTTEGRDGNTPLLALRLNFFSNKKKKKGGECSEGPFLAVRSLTDVHHPLLVPHHSRFEITNCSREASFSGTSICYCWYESPRIHLFQTVLFDFSTSRQRDLLRYRKPQKRIGLNLQLFTMWQGLFIWSTCVKKDLQDSVQVDWKLDPYNFMSAVLHCDSWQSFSM